MTEHQKRSWNDITSTVGLPAEGQETILDADILVNDDPETTRTILSTAQNPLVKTGVVLSGVALVVGAITTAFYFNQPSSPNIASQPTATASPQNPQIADLETENNKLKADKAFGLTPTGNSSPTPTSDTQSALPKNPTPVQSVVVKPSATPPQAVNSVPPEKPRAVTTQLTQTPTVSQKDKDIAATITRHHKQDFPIASTAIQRPISLSLPQSHPPTAPLIAPVPTVLPKNRTITVAIAPQRNPALPITSTAVHHPVLSSNPRSNGPIVKPLDLKPSISPTNRSIAMVMTPRGTQDLPSRSIQPKPQQEHPALATPKSIASAPTPIDWKIVSTSGTFGGRYSRNESTSNNHAEPDHPDKKAVGDLAEVPVIPALLPTPVVLQVASNTLAVPTPVLQQVTSYTPTIPKPLPVPLTDLGTHESSANELITGVRLESNNKTIDGKSNPEAASTVIYSSDEMAVINTSSSASETPSTEQSIQPGQVLKASLATPLQLLSEDNSSKPILLNINSPIIDLNGHIVIPSGAQVAGSFITSNNGFVQLRSEKLVYQGKEIILPDNLFAIQSENGEPLLAQSIQPGIGDATALARETGFYSAAQRVGQVLTAPDTNNTFSSGAGGVFSSNSSQNNRNVLGAVVEGFSNPIVQQQQQRSNAEIARISGQQRIVYLPIGHKFSLVIARTLKMR